MNLILMQYRPNFHHLYAMHLLLIFEAIPNTWGGGEGGVSSGHKYGIVTGSETSRI